MNSLTSATSWLAALNVSSGRLTKTVYGLPGEILTRSSFTGDWTIAQVLSHLGSAAEICTELVRRGIAGDTTPPTADDVQPVWQRWDALSGRDQREAWFEADRRHRQLLGSLNPRQVESVRIPYFAGLLSVTAYAGYRLSEQSVHGWDTDRDRIVRLELDDKLHLASGEPADPVGTVSGPAEALLRLVYGRNRQEDGVSVAGDITLEDLRSLFPGF